tara:strand:- start:597 stop:782 length:186 start_codon:yes stop_codon:yes gene_type:complete
MIKEFEINDILGAVDTISNIKKKKPNFTIKKDFDNIQSKLTNNDQEKSKKSEILVLDQMIE